MVWSIIRHNYPLFVLKCDFIFQQNSLLPVEEIDESLIGKFCVVVYDLLPYPCLILDVDDDEDKEVKVMARKGPNKFYWPLIEDRC